jgi:hypothetical protein
LSIFLLIQILHFISSVTFSCTYEYRDLKLHGDEPITIFETAYTCNAVLDYKCESREDFLHGVTKNHLACHECDRRGVKMLFFNPFNIKLNVIPMNIGFFFPSIEAFDCSNCSMYYIDSIDLAQFRNLKVLWLENNLINYLPGDLFEHNPNLEFFGFENNPIKKIGAGFFSYTPKLLRFNFEHTECFPSFQKFDLDEKIRLVSLECMHKTVPLILKQAVHNESSANRRQAAKPSFFDSCEEKYFMGREDIYGYTPVPVLG